MRPDNLDDYAGQEHILAPGKPLRVMLEGGKIPSCILYGPPGVGKTTLVRIMSGTTGRELLEINAVSAKVETLRTLVDNAKASKRMSGRSAIAFVDEIYHFNTKQQNVLLPSVETGDIILVGTTTENPWFEINKTLLSRMVVYTLKPLNEENISSLLEKALSDKERGLGMLEVTADRSVINKLASLAGGDARQALTRLEAAASSVALGGGREITLKIVAESTGMATQRYDRVSEDHYAVISALIKSMRGSDPDAALYWLARMLAAGDDLRFICRRLCIFASEDIGLADPMALIVAQNTAAAVDRVGMPEADIILGEAVVYLASAPKSNSTYLGIRAALKAVEEGDLMEVPYHLKNGGEGYQYPHDSPGHWIPQAYLPEQRRFYFPGKLGAEARIKERLKLFWKRFADDPTEEQSL
ncbi:MAG: replication-associated recombination protein A [Synergistaceae bacterium]|nr:replication-associated recombination protein A [Synergistaceae bacterium]